MSYRKCRAHIFHILSFLFSRTQKCVLDWVLFWVIARRPLLSELYQTASRESTTKPDLAPNPRKTEYRQQVGCRCKLNQSRFVTSSALCSYQSTKFHLISPLSSTHNQQSHISYHISTIIINNEAGLHSTFPQCIVDLQSATDVKCRWRHHRYGRCQYDSKRAPPDQSARDGRRNFICQWCVIVWPRSKSTSHFYPMHVLSYLSCRPPIHLPITPAKIIPPSISTLSHSQQIQRCRN